MASFDEKVTAIIARLNQQLSTPLQIPTMHDIQIRRQQEQDLKQQQLKQRATKARQKFFAQINQMHAEFRFQHLHECKRCPERFSSNSQLHRHIDAHHTKKPVENPSTSRSASPAPPATPTRHSAPPSPPSTPKLAPSPHPSPFPAPTVAEKPSPAAQTVENAPPTPPQTPTPLLHREISTPALKSPAKTAKFPETSPRIYLPPHKRAYMTIAQLFTKFGSSWPNSACSKPGRPIRKLNPTAPVWIPSNASKSSQSDASKSNCASASANSAFSKVSTISTPLPPKPPRQQPFVHPYWPASSSPRRRSSNASWTPRKSMGNTWDRLGIIDALLRTLVTLLGQLTCSGIT